MSRLTFPHRKEGEQHAAKCSLGCIKEKMKDEWHFDFNRDPKICKSVLHEYAVRMNLRTPKYTTIQKEELRPVFISSLLFDGKTYTGEVCASKKEAEQLAAMAVIKTLLGKARFHQTSVTLHKQVIIPVLIDDVTLNIYVTGSDLVVLRQIINSKNKVYNARHKFRNSSFKLSSL
eukprot:XP_015583861.1 double-stranded RNA-binding protein 4 [Ricinus communis]